VNRAPDACDHVCVITFYKARTYARVAARWVPITTGSVLSFDGWVRSGLEPGAARRLYLVIELVLAVLSYSPIRSAVGMHALHDNTVHQCVDLDVCVFALH
jgi:hypothetical protein